MLKIPTLLLAGAALLALPLAALSQNQAQLVERYTALAGSQKNAASLVAGLRDGKPVTLGDRTLNPPTGKMGYGNVDTALALAEASLKEKGIINPTPKQLETSLMNILTMRAEGKGWGQIAQSMGFKLGEIKRSDKAEARGGRPERVAKAERPHKPEKPERPQRPEKPERPEKPR